MTVAAPFVRPDFSGASIELLATEFRLYLQQSRGFRDRGSDRAIDPAKDAARSMSVFGAGDAGKLMERLKAHLGVADLNTIDASAISPPAPLASSPRSTLSAAPPPAGFDLRAMANESLRMMNASKPAAHQPDDRRQALDQGLAAMAPAAIANEIRKEVASAAALGLTISGTEATRRLHARSQRPANQRLSQMDPNAIADEIRQEMASAAASGLPLTYAAAAHRVRQRIPA